MKPSRKILAFVMTCTMLFPIGACAKVSERSEAFDDYIAQRRDYLDLFDTGNNGAKQGLDALDSFSYDGKRVKKITWRPSAQSCPKRSTN